MNPKIKSFFQVPVQSDLASLALLILRLVAGIAFMIHGWGKIQHPFDWMGAQAQVPGFFQFLAAFSEFFGGLAWILGLVTPLASLGIAFTMLVAVLVHAISLHAPFVNPTGGPSFEPAMDYFAISLVLLFAGPGRRSLDKVLFGTKTGGISLS